jgi:hypothetical protein
MLSREHKSDLLARRRTLPRRWCGAITIIHNVAIVIELYNHPPLNNCAVGSWNNLKGSSDLQKPTEITCAIALQLLQDRGDLNVEEVTVGSPIE